MLEDAIAKARPVNFDLLGLSMTEHVKPAVRGPEMRSNRYSFFKEVDAATMKSYSPDQIAIVLEQRENLRRVIENEERSPAALKRTYYMPSSGTVTRTAATTAATIPPPPGFTGPRVEKPWVPLDEDECQFKCCHNCRPTCESRSYLSLDGILKDDIPASAAVGFGFHLQGTRPVIDADIVKNIGYRPVPLSSPSRHESVTPASSSMLSILDVIDEQIIEMARQDEAKSSELGKTTRKTTDANTGGINGSLQLNGSAIRPSWAPHTIPAANAHEVKFAINAKPTHMEEQEEDGCFHEEPLEVANGVAVLEESVEMHVPDVITQI
ncbi:hypothetical protein BKA67DRAFT_663586 [Truncatella angustata]|uniref:Uncharacterized protein n=1 Tax=Truncatella angustata TaxID=152316 RepID=A0A9P8RPG0_9PEZI|nr:uncharacterized protein BKA67DRAFT_663586 [Truncatella angustata]KAH6647250.1 hypothetical protein BKA67DRAFT_663586 [Truncatella angustata]